MGVPPGHLPTEHEAGLKDGHVLRVKAVQASLRTLGHRALRQHSRRRFFDQLHGQYDTIAEDRTPTDL